MSEPARPLAAVPPDEWKPVDGFSKYEWSHRGQVRNVTTGVVLKTRVSNRGYVLVDVRNDAGGRKTVTMHTMVLLAHVGPRPDGMDASHFNDVATDNRWPENLGWETKPRNEGRKYESGRHPYPTPPERAPKSCVRCSKAFKGNGKRCHECVVEIGEHAAVLLEDGATLDEACEALAYPHPSGLHTLAVKYGGYGQAAKYQRSPLIDALVTLRDRWLERVCNRAPRGGDRA